jgi:hypothetical protein
VDCEGKNTVIELGPDGEDIDFLDDPGFEWPPGDWCEAAVTFDEPLYIHGVLFPNDEPDEDEDEEEDEEFDFELILSVGTVVVVTDDGFAVDGNNHVFELGIRGWINPWLVDLDREDLVVTDEEHPLHDELADVVTHESGLFEDEDTDGFLSDEEYYEGPVARGDARDEDEQDNIEDEPPAEADSGAESIELSASKGGCGRSDFSFAWLLPLCLFSSRRISRGDPTPQEP